MTERGNDGLTDAERDELARQYAEGPGNRHVTPEAREAMRRAIERRRRNA